MPDSVSPADKPEERRPPWNELQRMRSQLEEGCYLGSCDWGCCGGEQVGWAVSSRDESGVWLAICQECSDGNGKETDPYPVDGFVTFEQVLPRPDGYLERDR